MGGKLSEGINFNDDLARCVVVIGLPYPNNNDIIMKERMKYADYQAQGVHSENSAGQRLYESICMRQVNQSIGRCIRHRHDYAAIILLDKRYEKPHIMNQLPDWINKTLQPMNQHESIRNKLISFLEACAAQIQQQRQQLL
jgi:chromosome transmission fidelity protein 1